MSTYLFVLVLLRLLQEMLENSNLPFQQEPRPQARKKLRQQLRALRQQLTDDEQLLAAKNLTTQLIEHKKVISAKNIALYLANDGELNTMPFIQWCWQHHKNIYLPVIHPFCAGQLLFLKFTQNTSMTTNKYGISEPKLNVNHLCLLSDLDILFTPLVAFDPQGNRLGMGGGFYDRTLSAWFKNSHKNPQPRLYPVGLAHDCQQVSAINTEIWDIPLPEIITPTKTFLF